MGEVCAPAALPPARETAMRGGAFNSAVRELLSYYISLEEYYMEESLAKVGWAGWHLTALGAQQRQTRLRCGLLATAAAVLAQLEKPASGAHDARILEPPPPILPILAVLSPTLLCPTPPHPAHTAPTNRRPSASTRLCPTP